MKKERFLLSVLAAMTVLASCGRNAEISGETVPLSESVDEAGGLSSATMDENGGLLEDGDYFTPRDPGLSFAQTH